MSKSKSNYNSRYSSIWSRGPVVTATPRVRPMPSPRLSPYNSLSQMPPILLEDRRTFHPERQFRPPAAYYRSDTRLVSKVVAPNGKRSIARPLWSLQYTDTPHTVGFARPDRVAICIRRKVRRQVLLAAGVGGKRVRKGERTYKSGFHCN